MGKNNLERTIDKYFKYLNSKGIHCHKNHPERLHSGKYINGEPFDYEILGNPVKVFDTKETSDDYLRINKKELKQMKNLLDCQMQGHDAFFLIWFSKRKKMMKVTALDCVEILADQNTIHFDNCQEVKELNDL
jgi:hypothetical protein